MLMKVEMAEISILERGRGGGQGGPEELTAATSFAPVPNAELSTRIYDLARRLPAGRAKRTTVSLAGLL